MGMGDKFGNENRGYEIGIRNGDPLLVIMVGLK